MIEKYLTDELPPGWVLRLYVAGNSDKSKNAIKNLNKICEKHLAFHTTFYIIEVIDLLKSPQLAEDDKVIAAPTLIRKMPEPLRRIFGDLSNDEAVISGLGLGLQLVNSRTKL